jgi:hypothetical protein
MPGDLWPPGTSLTTRGSETVLSYHVLPLPAKPAMGSRDADSVDGPYRRRTVLVCQRRPAVNGNANPYVGRTRSACCFAGNRVQRIPGAPTWKSTAPISAWARMPGEAACAVKAESAPMRRRSFWWEVWRNTYLVGHAGGAGTAPPHAVMTSSRATARTTSVLAVDFVRSFRSQPPRGPGPSLGMRVSTPLRLGAFAGAGALCRILSGARQPA